MTDTEWNLMKFGKSIENVDVYTDKQGIRLMIWYKSSICLYYAPTSKFPHNKPPNRV